MSAEQVVASYLRQTFEWSKSESLAGVMAETQYNNVPACELEARYGFKLSGFDAALYGATAASRREVALFWQWHGAG